MGLQRQHMSAYDKLRCVEPSGMCEGMSHYSNQRALDQRDHQPAAIGLDTEKHEKGMTLTTASCCGTLNRLSELRGRHTKH